MAPVLEEQVGAALVAMLLGALLGLERQRSAEDDGQTSFAGLRTFTLLSLAGFLGAVSSLAGAPLVLPAVLLAIGTLVVVSYVRSSGQDAGTTTEVAAIVAPLLGALVGLGQAPLAAAVGVLVAVLLAQRKPLHRFVHALSEEEVLAVLKFAIVVAVVLPVLPDRPVGPYGAIVPFRVGVLVATICGLGLAGYVLVRLVGSRAGFALAGLLGGLVSSTAVTLGFSGKARETPALVPALASGIILASTIVYLRGLVFTAIFDPPIARFLLPRVAVLVAVGAAFVAWGYGKAQTVKPGRLDLGNPVELGKAAMLGLMFAFVLLLGRAAQARLGTAGFWATAAVAGLVDVDSTVVTSMDLHRQNLVTAEAAGAGFLLATVANLLAKGGIVVVTGGRALARRVLPAFLGMAVVTGIVFLVS